MAEIELPELEERALAFVPDSAVRGPDGSPVGFLAGRISIGGPLSVPIEPTSPAVADSADLRTFVEQEAGRFAYHLIHMSITFAAEPEKPRLERATVALTLSAAGGVAPIAWSMDPLAESDTSTVTTTLEFAPTLKLSEIEVGLGSVGRERERPEQDLYIEAQNPMASDPRWEFRRTRSRALRGSQRLVLVVRAPWQAESRLSGKVTAATLHRFSILRHEHADLPWPLTFRAEF